MSKLRLGLLKNKLIGICVLIFVGLCVGLSSCTIFTKTNKQLVKLSEELGHTQFKKVMLPDGKYVRTLFTKVDSSKKPSLVLIHGAPGGVDNFKHFHENQKLLEKYNILSYDRPGYGKGTQYDYKSMPSLQKQADVLQKVILDYGITEYVLFSHSFGGPIALRHEAKHQRAKGILLASVAVDPEHEKIFWFAHIGRWKATRWMLAKALKTSADEKFAHVEELKKLQPELSSIKTKVIAIHGDEDSLVPYENLSYINKNLVNASLESITIKEENHFYPFSKPEICVEKLMAF